CFFFPSSRRHTRFDCDWSSDVCSSDLGHYSAGGAAQLARKTGIAQPSVSNWTRIPAEGVVSVEAATGIARRHLRPDLYSEPAVEEHAVDPLDVARAREYALLAALLSGAPSKALL